MDLRRKRPFLRTFYGLRHTGAGRGLSTMNARYIYIGRQDRCLGATLDGILPDFGEGETGSNSGVFVRNWCENRIKSHKFKERPS